MLTAWDSQGEVMVALPDYERAEEVAWLRHSVQVKRLICPACRQPLWIRMGEQRRHHFAHRELADCPYESASEAVLHARSTLYRYFRDLAASGVLSAIVELEPLEPRLPEGRQLDLLLRDEKAGSVAIVIVDKRFKAEFRSAMLRYQERSSLALRLVFLQSMLQTEEGFSDRFLLNTTHRDFRHHSPIGVDTLHSSQPNSLHFLDGITGELTSLRGAYLVHDPQVYKAARVSRSSLAKVFWDQDIQDWMHSGEPRAKPLPPLRPQAETDTDHRARTPMASAPKALPRPERTAPAESYQAPAWVRDGLLCIHCQVQTTRWTTGSPGEGICVCRDCFRKGLR